MNPADRLLVQLWLKQAATVRLPEQAAADSPVAALRAAKKESDRRNYRDKHRLLSRLLRERAAEFSVEPGTGPYRGLVHSPSGFQIHAPASLLAAQPPAPTRT